MCKGVREEQHHFGPLRNRRFYLTREDVVVSHVHTRGTSVQYCEICGLKASLYCQADNAYLCRRCDKGVHKANFLAFRHIRSFLCNTCHNPTRRYLIGATVEISVMSHSS